MARNGVREHLLCVSRKRRFSVVERRTKHMRRIDCIRRLRPISVNRETKKRG